MYFSIFSYNVPMNYTKIEQIILILRKMLYFYSIVGLIIFNCSLHTTLSLTSAYI